MPRMKILNTIEQEAFESPPVFNSFQRKQYFDFPSAIQQAAASLRTPVNQLCFLLSCGYFKASKRLFPVQTFRSRDVEYVAERADLALEEIEPDHYPKGTAARHQAWILDFYGFRASVRTVIPYWSKRSHAWCGPSSSPNRFFGAVWMS